MGSKRFDTERSEVENLVYIYYLLLHTYLLYLHFNLTPTPFAFASI